MNRIAMACGLLLVFAFSPDANARKPVIAEACEGEDVPEICKPARKACTKALADANVRKSFPAKPFIKNCIDDVVKAGKIEDAMLNDHRTLYVNAARTRADRPHGNNLHKAPQARE